MARKIVGTYPPPPPPDVAEADLAAFVGRTGQRKKVPNLRDAAFAQRRDEARARMASGDWAGALPVHFVAMYAHLHAGVYGVEALELGPTERVRACGAAKRMLDREFAGDAAAMAVFMRWAWQREQGREKWRRDNGAPGRRLGWAFMFGGSILTDYRLDRARAANGGRR